MKNKVLELFGLPTSRPKIDWASVARDQHCPYLDRKCLKNRKSEPDISIGTCTVGYGKEGQGVLICPFRLLERQQIFTDCVHLLTLHEPGNEFHVVSEISIPGGSIDYVLVSARNNRVKDFVGIELQTLDTTGTLWPERQRFLQSHGVTVRLADVDSGKGFGMNWKMTAKTILVQLHHKIETLEHISKHLVLVLQDRLLAYMKAQFSFDHLQQARIGDSMHIHAYKLTEANGSQRLDLGERLSTDSSGIATCLGLQASPHVELTDIIELLESKIGAHTRLTPAAPPPAGKPPPSEP